MYEYIKQLLVHIRDVNSAYSYMLIGATVEELSRIDPRNLLPDVRYDFVANRAWLASQRNATYDPHSSAKLKVNGVCEKLITTLEGFVGEGSYRAVRSFDFVSDTDLKQIIERDYLELKTILFPSGAWKSVVILAGSILEAILYDALTKDAATIARAETSPKAPNKSLAKCEWKLIKLIEVASDIDLLPKERGNTIDQVLRDYRNFVHPRKELRSAHPCSESEAFLAIGALDGVCNHFDGSRGTS